MKQQDGTYKRQSSCSSCMWGKNSPRSDGESSSDEVSCNEHEASCNDEDKAADRQQIQEKNLCETGSNNPEPEWKGIGASSKGQESASSLQRCRFCKQILHNGYDCSMCRACFGCCLNKDGCPDWTLCPMALKGNQTSRSRRRSPSCTYLCMECPTDRPQGKCVHKAGHENSPWKEHICQRCIDFEEDPTGQSFRPAPVHKDRVHYPSRKVAFDEVPLPNVGRRPQTFLSTN